MKTLLALLAPLLLATTALAAPPVVTPATDTIAVLESGAAGITLAASCTSDTQPTAVLWVDLGWLYFSGNVRPAFALPVTRNADGTWRAEVTIYPPTVWQALPQLDAAKRWIVFSNADGSTASGRTQILTVATGAQVQHFRLAPIVQPLTF